MCCATTLTIASFETPSCQLLIMLDEFEVAWRSIRIDQTDVPHESSRQQAVLGDAAIRTYRKVAVQYYENHYFARSKKEVASNKKHPASNQMIQNEVCCYCSSARAAGGSWSKYSCLVGSRSKAILPSQSRPSPGWLPGRMRCMAILPLSQGRLITK